MEIKNVEKRLDDKINKVFNIALDIKDELVNIEERMSSKFDQVLTVVQSFATKMDDIKTGRVTKNYV